MSSLHAHSIEARMHIKSMSDLAVAVVIPSGFPSKYSEAEKKKSNIHNISCISINIRSFQCEKPDIRSSNDTYCDVSRVMVLFGCQNLFTNNSNEKRSANERVVKGEKDERKKGTLIMKKVWLKSNTYSIACALNSLTLPGKKTFPPKHFSFFSSFRCVNHRRHILFGWWMFMLYCMIQCVFYVVFCPFTSCLYEM